MALKELHLKLSELYPRWKKIPRNAMLAQHQCLSQLNSHLSRWQRRLNDVVAFYYATLTDDTESDADNEHSLPVGKEAVYEEVPAPDQANPAKTPAQQVQGKASDRKEQGDAASKMSGTDRRRSDAEFLWPSAPSMKDGPPGAIDKSAAGF